MTISEKEQNGAGKPGSRFTLYLFDNHFETLHATKKLLKHYGYRVTGIPNTKTLYECLAILTPDAILFHAGTGHASKGMYKEVRMRCSRDIPIIVFSMTGDSIKEVRKAHAGETASSDADLGKLKALLQDYLIAEEELI